MLHVKITSTRTTWKIVTYIPARRRRRES